LGVRVILPAEPLGGVGRGSEAGLLAGDLQALGGFGAGVGFHQCILHGFSVRFALTGDCA
jgi:hypothetical protein